MAPVSFRLPAKPPAVPFPEVNFADLHRGIGIPAPVGYHPLTPPSSSSPLLPTSAPRGPHQTSVSSLYPSPPDDKSDRRRRLDQQRGRREMRERDHPRQRLAAPFRRPQTPEKEETRPRPRPRHQRGSPIAAAPRRQSGLHHQADPSSTPHNQTSKGTAAFSSDVDEEARLVQGYFSECLDDGVTVLTSEEQGFLAKYLEVDEEGCASEQRELVRRLVRQLDWSGCSVALTYRLAAWAHAHDGCDRTVVGLLTQRLSRPDAVDPMRSFEKEEELVMCRTVIGISQKRLEKSRR